MRLPILPRLLRASVYALTAAWACTAPQAYAQSPQEPALIIEDNDFLGPGGSDIQSTIPLLGNPHIKVLGFTVTTGDDWENAESAHLRRFLELAKRTDIPVADGAVYPLLNTPALMKLHEQAYGRIPWKGAWGGLGDVPTTQTQPALPTLPEGQPNLAAAPEPAAQFLIRMVHEHPHKVTIVAAGPLTNLALAIKLDPTFAQTAKQLVFMGGLLDTDLMSVTGNANFASDFNMIFDPEAAHITLTAPWPAITVVGNISNSVQMTPAYMARIAQNPTPVTRYLSRYISPLPMWDEMTTAIAADPTLVQHSVKAFMDIDISPGSHYGHARIWAKDLAPRAQPVREVTLVQTLDSTRFLKNFAQQAQAL